MSQPAAPPVLKYATRCRVPGCNTGPNGGPQEFSSSPLDIPTIGQPHERVVRFVTGLMGHLEKKHPQVFMQIRGSIAEFTGFLVVSAFQCEDPQLQALHERIRSGLQVASRRPGVASVVSDEAIQEKAAGLLASDFRPDQIEEGFQLLLRDMRDLLLEQGQYAPQAPTPSPLVKV